jgi:hypothetical protein
MQHLSSGTAMSFCRLQNFRESQISQLNGAHANAAPASQTIPGTGVPRPNVSLAIHISLARRGELKGVGTWPPLITNQSLSQRQSRQVVVCLATGS